MTRPVKEKLYCPPTPLLFTPLLLFRSPGFPACREAFFANTVFLRDSRLCHAALGVFWTQCPVSLRVDPGF